MVETLTLILLATIACLLWAMMSRQRIVESRLQRLDRLEEIQRQVGRIAEAGGDLELRRLEHVLIDIRDGQKRLEERLLHLAETSGKESVLESDSPHNRREPERNPGTHLSERITNRLLAMGYERIQLLSSLEELSELAMGEGEAEDGDVQVEARRAGAVCKGRVAMRSGAIAGVELKASHGMFP
jgi:hypothetical protein